MLGKFWERIATSRVSDNRVVMFVFCLCHPMRCVFCGKRIFGMVFPVDDPKEKDEKEICCSRKCVSLAQIDDMVNTVNMVKKFLEEKEDEEREKNCYEPY